MDWENHLSAEGVNRMLTPADKFLGLKVTALSEKGMEAELTVGDQHLQPFGLLHGGVSCLIAETMGSIAANLVAGERYAAVGMTLTCNHMRSARKGDRIDVLAQPRHIGKRSHVWQIEFSHSGRLISQINLTVSILEKKD